MFLEIFSSYKYVNIKNLIPLACIYEHVCAVIIES